MFHPIDSYWRVSLLVVVDIIASNAPGKGLSLYGVVSPHNSPSCQGSFTSSTVYRVRHDRTEHIYCRCSWLATDYGPTSHALHSSILSMIIN